MQEPKSFLKQMNKLCIEMTHTRRKKGGKKARKEILRKMKKLSWSIEKHAQRYRALLEEKWEATDWSEAEAKAVIRRIDNILTQLPQAIAQAHERIIGERQVPADKKLFSLYDTDADLIVRGKSGSEVEFGQKLLLTEQTDGLIVDWELYPKKGPSDNALLQITVNRCQKHYGAVLAVSADRAFNSAKNDEFLEKQNVINGTCPRSPFKLKEKLEDSDFVDLQTRRSQTEARIGIFKNVFLGKPLRSQILANKQHALNWCVLSHNLWLLARKIAANKEEELLQAA
jgi:hypothetical protein